MPRFYWKKVWDQLSPWLYLYECITKCLSSCLGPIVTKTLQCLSSCLGPIVTMTLQCLSSFPKYRHVIGLKPEKCLHKTDHSSLRKFQGKFYCICFNNVSVVMISLYLIQILEMRFYENSISKDSTYFNSAVMAWRFGLKFKALLHLRHLKSQVSHKAACLFLGQTSNFSGCQMPFKLFGHMTFLGFPRSCFYCNNSLQRFLGKLTRSFVIKHLKMQL